MPNIRIDHRHQIKGLNDFRTVLARQRNIGLEQILAVQLADLFEEVIAGFRRMTTHLQERQYQRRELMAHRNADETHAHVAACTVQRERRLTLVVLIRFVAGQTRRQRGDLLQHCAHLLRLLGVVERRSDRYIVSHFAEVGLQLILDGSVQHDGLLF